MYFVFFTALRGTAASRRPAFSLMSDCCARPAKSSTSTSCSTTRRFWRAASGRAIAARAPGRRRPGSWRRNRPPSGNKRWRGPSRQGSIAGQATLALAEQRGTRRDRALKVAAAASFRPLCAPTMLAASLFLLSFSPQPNILPARSTPLALSMMSSQFTETRGIDSEMMQTDLAELPLELDERENNHRVNSQKFVPSPFALASSVWPALLLPGAASAAGRPSKGCRRHARRRLRAVSGRGDGCAHAFAR